MMCGVMASLNVGRCGDLWIDVLEYVKYTEGLRRLGDGRRIGSLPIQSSGRPGTCK